MPHKKPAEPTLSKIISRIVTMERAEFANRLCQAVRKRADTVLFGLGIDPSYWEIPHSSSSFGKFFFGREDIPRRIDLLRQRMPKQAEQIISKAEKICRHRFDLLGYENLEYGQKIDWQREQVHGKRAPRDSWLKIKYLDFNKVGDAKVTWELNRHQHLVTLAKAYRLTNDHRFADEALAQWHHWQNENPYPLGVNWTSSLEVAFRCLAWLWMYFLIEDALTLPMKFKLKYLRSIALAARHIERYLSTYFSPNTHVLGEAAALFFIGTLCPELRSARRWQRQGWEILLRESERQIRADGFYFEQSTYYHVYALDFFLHARVLAKLNGMPFPAEYDQRLEKMLTALAILCRAGSPSKWGDDDGGRVFDPARNRAENLMDPLATGAILFGRGDFKFLVPEPPEETLWLLGEEGIAKFDRIESEQPTMSSFAFRQTGLYVMSSREKKLQATLDAGPQGSLGAGHGHADALSLTVHAWDRELLGDPGTYVYVSEGNERNQFRGTAAHNTLQLDGRDQSDPGGPFAWQRLTRTEAETWISGRTFDLFTGSHDGYSQLENPAIHRRCVFFRKPQFWLVRDLVLGTGKHQIDLHWHLTPGLSPINPADGQLFVSCKKEGIALVAPEGHNWTQSLQQGMWSAAYGRIEPATEIRFTTVATLPVEFATLLVPVKLTSDHVPSRARLIPISISSGAKAYCFICEKEEHYFVFAEEKCWTLHEWKSDSNFLYFHRSDGRLHMLVLCNGSFIEYLGKRIVNTPRPVSRLEIIMSRGNLETSCSDADIRVSLSDLRKVVEAETQTFLG